LEENSFFKLEHETKDIQVAKKSIPTLQQIYVTFFFDFFFFQKKLT